MLTKDPADVRPNFDPLGILAVGDNDAEPQHCRYRRKSSVIAWAITCSSVSAMFTVVFPWTSWLPGLRSQGYPTSFPGSFAWFKKFHWCAFQNKSVIFGHLHFSEHSIPPDLSVFNKTFSFGRLQASGQWLINQHAIQNPILTILQPTQFSRRLLMRNPSFRGDQWLPDTTSHPTTARCALVDHGCSVSNHREPMFYLWRSSKGKTAHFCLPDKFVCALGQLPNLATSDILI